MTEQPAAAKRGGLLRIGLWGAPGSGKTTYLAALKVAVTRYEGVGNWLMFGMDEESSEFLSLSSDQLLRERRFPDATMDSQLYRFRFTGEVPSPPAPKQGMLRKPLPDPPPSAVSFDLDVLDPPGKLFGRSGVAAGEVEAVSIGSETDLEETDEIRDTAQEGEDLLLDHLEDCHGVVLLFDPVRDAHLGDAFDWFHHTLEQLTRRILARPRGTLTRLPHYFAICVAKYDDVNIFERAHRLGLTETDDEPPYRLRVPDENAEELFQDLCRLDGGNGDLMLRSLQSHIAPDRLRFFVTSAIGQYVDSQGRFRRRDASNVTRLPDGTLAIRGSVHPINLIEPLLWLEKSIREGRGR